MTAPASAIPTYRMPAEWEQHGGTWLAWPHRTSDWPGKITTIVTVYAEIIKAVSRNEIVHLIVPNPVVAACAQAHCVAAHVNMDNLQIHECSTDRSWLRDSGPIFVKNSAGNPIALDWHFNAWAKYRNWKKDDRVPEFVASVRQVARVQPMHNGKRVVLEGGSIDLNGQGLLLTTEECLLSPVQQRNPTFGRADYEAVFHEFLGVEKVLWLNRGIAGDDTHGHVDDLARFVGRNTIVTVLESNPIDDNYAPLQENLDRLKGFTDQNGGKFTIVPLPMPRPVWYDNLRLPASYANFYIGNGIVIVPTFNDPADRVALGILAELFPSREVVGIHCTDLVWGLGTLHCMTQQEPA
jgi:agmatine deiminase